MWDPVVGTNEAQKLRQGTPMSPANMNYFCKMVCLSLWVAGRTPQPPPPAVGITPCLCLRRDPPRHHRGLSGRGCALQKWGKVSYSEDNIVRHRKSASKACVSRRPLCTPIHSHLHCARLLDNLRRGCVGCVQDRDSVVTDSSHGLTKRPESGFTGHRLTGPPSSMA